MPQQNHRFFVVISSLKYTLQNVVFLSTKKPIYYFVSIMAIAAYLRVSTDRQDLDNQHYTIGKHCKVHGLSRSATWLPTPKAANCPDEIVIWPA